MPIERHLDANSVWVFDDEVAQHFDEMLARSIPGYHAMRAVVNALVNRYLPEGGTLVDLGCSLGAQLAPFVNRARCIGVDKDRKSVV